MEERLLAPDYNDTVYLYTDHDEQAEGVDDPAGFDFCGATYIAHHNGALPTGGSYRRSTCMDRVLFGADGAMGLP